MAQQLLVSVGSIIQRFHVLARDNQDVGRRLWVYVANDDAAFIAVQKIGGNLTGDDLAKEAVIFGHFDRAQPRISLTSNFKPGTECETTVSPRLYFRELR